MEFVLIETLFDKKPYRVEFSFSLRYCF